MARGSTRAQEGLTDGVRRDNGLAGSQRQRGEKDHVATDGSEDGEEHGK